MRYSVVLLVALLAGCSGAPAGLAGGDTTDATAAAVGGEAGPDTGKTCYLFWASQCFEIRNARTRDITHHVLITRGPGSLRTGEAECSAAVEARLGVDERADLLDDFNDILEDIDGCDTLERPPLKSFDHSDEAIRAYHRLTREGSHTRIHELDPPRLRNAH